MGLDDILRKGVAIINRTTRDLQTTVLHERWNGYTVEGAPSYAAAVSRKALVDRSARRVRTDAGDEVVSTTHIIFLTPIAPLTVAVADGGPRQNPVDKRDRISITLPGGGTMTGPILQTKGFVDAGSTTPGQTFTAEVFLG